MSFAFPERSSAPEAKPASVVTTELGGQGPTHDTYGHSAPGFTIDTCQHVRPGMQADAAPIFEQLVAPGAASQTSEQTRLKRRKKTA